MSSAAVAATAPVTEGAPKKSKKLLFIIIGVVLLALIGAGAAFYILKKNTAESSDGLEGEAAVEHKEPEHALPPTFLPLESMVVNLADPGGNRFVQLAITLQVQDMETSEAMKVYIPSIRNDILMLVSERTSEEILKPEGKEKLASDITERVSKVMGYGQEKPKAEEGGKKRHATPRNPLKGVLFSSFIVQ